MPVHPQLTCPPNPFKQKKDGEPFDNTLLLKIEKSPDKSNPYSGTRFYPSSDKWLANFGLHDEHLIFHKKKKKKKRKYPDKSGFSFSFRGHATAKRLSVFNRDGNKCLCCGSTDDLTLDHVIPRSKGGGSKIENLQTLCARCNGRKSNRFLSLTELRIELHLQSLEGQPCHGGY